MRRYTTKHDDDLQLGAPSSVTTKRCSCGATLGEWLAVLSERLQHVAGAVNDLTDRMNACGGHIAEVNGRLGAIESAFGVVETRLGAVENRLVGVESRLGVVEERLNHTATKSWVLGCAVALLATMLTGTLGGVWWIIQQHIGPLLRASAG